MSLRIYFLLYRLLGPFSLPSSCSCVEVEVDNRTDTTFTVATLTGKFNFARGAISQRPHTYRVGRFLCQMRDDSTERSA